MEENIVKKTMILIGIAIVLPVLSGCSSMSQRKLVLDQNWGRAHETARFTQTINPDAGEYISEEQGIDGVAAKYNYDKYRKGFKVDETPTQIFNIHLGGE